MIPIPNVIERWLWHLAQDRADYGLSLVILVEVAMDTGLVAQHLSSVSWTIATVLVSAIAVTVALRLIKMRGAFLAYRALRRGGGVDEMDQVRRGLRGIR